MSVIQRSYFCHFCQEQRLFTQQQMNHTPHILAFVFLCGLWLPMWLLTAAFYNAKFHCSQCGTTPQFRKAVKQDTSQQFSAQGASQEPSAIAKWLLDLSSSLMKAFKASAIGIWFFSLSKILQIVVSVLSIFLGITVLSIFSTIVRFAVSQSSKPQPIANNLSANSNSLYQTYLKNEADFKSAKLQLESAKLQQEINAERLTRVKGILKYEKKFVYKDYYFIYSQLNQIPSDAPEYQEAQKILSQYKKQIELAKQKAAKPEPEDPKLEKIRKEAYKIGLQSGGNRPSYNTEDTEVKNTEQVQILAETAADLVYKPKPEHRQMWVFQFRRGFITGYNNRRPNAPIRNMVGRVVDEAHQ